MERLNKQNNEKRKTKNENMRPVMMQLGQIRQSINLYRKRHSVSSGRKMLHRTSQLPVLGSRIGFVGRIVLQAKTLHCGFAAG